MILAIFRLNGLLLDAGNRLVAPLGLTSARWQVLGTLVGAGAPLTTAYIARNMGLARQSVQRTVDLLAEEGFVVLRSNPHHKRAPLVEATPKGEGSLLAALRLQRPWAARITSAISGDRLIEAEAVLRLLEEGLTAQGLSGPDVGL